MRDITTKTPGSSLTADEFNDIPGELENAITSTDITLSAADLFQLAKAISIYAARGDYYEDDGVADAYVLNTVGDLKAPNSYEDGMRARFKAANSNTGASTVSVAGIGVVNITGAISGDIVAGEFISMEYNATSSEFEIATQASGDMLKTTYDPTSINSSAFARANMTGTQLSSTISDFASQVAALTASTLSTSSLLHIRHQTASGVDGGDFTTGSWNTAPLNTVVTNNISGSSLSSDQITLPSGSYWVECFSTVGAIGTSQPKIRNITDASDGFIGMTKTTNDTSFANGVIDIPSSKVFELQVNGNATVLTTGFGVAASFGVVNVYREVKIWKVS